MVLEEFAHLNITKRRVRCFIHQGEYVRHHKVYKNFNITAYNIRHKQFTRPYDSLPAGTRHGLGYTPDTPERTRPFQLTDFINAQGVKYNRYYTHKYYECFRAWGYTYEPGVRDDDWQQPDIAGTDP